MGIASRSRALVSVDGFAEGGAPESVGGMDLRPPPGRQYVLRMALRVEGGDLRVPEDLAWLAPMLELALSHQRSIGVDHPFVYATVRHGVVDSVTDDEWHVDGFSTRVAHVPEQNYVWCDQVGTEFAPVAVRFPADFDPLRHNVNHLLADHVDPAMVGSCAERTVFCMDPYVLHRRPAGTAGMQRPFVRLSFVPIEIDDVNNTQNPLLPRAYARDGVAHRNRLETYRRA